jgi:hypothetical protein
MRRRFEGKMTTHKKSNRKDSLKVAKGQKKKKPVSNNKHRKKSAKKKSVPKWVLTYSTIGRNLTV